MVASLLLHVKMASAEVLVPATTDDQKNFDQQVVAPAPVAQTEDTKDADSGGKSKKDKKAKKENFGALVSAEAKKLKDESKDDRKGMGKWVSEQRRKNTAHPARPASSESSGSDSDDSKRSAPAAGSASGNTAPSTGHGRK